MEEALHLQPVLILLVVDIKAMDNITILTITGAIAILTASVFVLRAGMHWYGGDQEEED